MGAAYARPYHARSIRSRPANRTRTFCSTGSPAYSAPDSADRQILVRLGQRGSERGIFLAWRREPAAFHVAPGFSGRLLRRRPRDRLLHSGNPDRQMFVGSPHGPFKTFGVTGRITGTAFSPDNNMLYVLLFQPSGETSLVRISVHELRTKTIASDLDAAPNWNTMAISPDGRSAFIALASAGAPDNAARHQSRRESLARNLQGGSHAPARARRWSQLRASMTTILQSPMEISTGRAMRFAIRWPQFL